MSDAHFATVMFAPGAILVFILVIVPIIMFIAMSFLRIELAKDDNTPFVGLNNYLRIGGDDDFMASVPRTILLGAGFTILSVPLSLATALLLNRTFRGVGVLGVAVLLPWAIAPVVTGSYWNFMFNSHFGLATGIATALGLTNGPIPWLEDSSLAMGVAVVASAWQAMPVFALLLLASLKTIPDVLYRAAKIDGATRWQAFRWVTVPGIRNMLLIVTVLAIIASLQIFAMLVTLTGGGPGHQTTVISYYIYQSAFQKLSLGYSSALAVLLLLLIITFSSALLVLRQREKANAPVAVTDDTDELTLATRAPAAGLRFAPATTGRAGAAAAAPAARWEDDVRHSRWRIPDGVARAVMWFGTALLLIWLLAPILWIAIASVQPESAITVAPPALSLNLNLDWYAFLLGEPRWNGSMIVSTVLAVSTMVITIVIAALAAYPLARLTVPFRGTIIGVLVFTQMVPGVVLAIPILLVYVKAAEYINLRDTVPGLILVNVAFWVPLIIWLLRNYFQAVPRSIESAARIDGCSRIGTLFRVTFPAARAGIAAIAILILIGTWNEFLFAVILGDKNAVTVTRRITDIQAINPVFGVIYSEQAAAGILAVMPPLILVLLFHRRIVGGLTEGFVKG
jgi:multiple sugar transport system permease protein